MKKSIFVVCLIVILYYILPPFHTEGGDPNDLLKGVLYKLNTFLISDYYEQKKIYPKDLDFIKKLLVKNRKIPFYNNLLKIHGKDIDVLTINYKPKEEDEYIYKDGNVLKEKTIVYYLNKKENTFYLYGVGKDNKIIRDKNKRTGNLFFNIYKPFCVTNEGTEYSGFPKK